MRRFFETSGTPFLLSQLPFIAVTAAASLVVFTAILALPGEKKPMIVRDTSNEERIKAHGFDFLLPELTRRHLLNNHDFITILIAAKTNGHQFTNSETVMRAMLQSETPDYMLEALIELDHALPYSLAENRALFDNITTRILVDGFHPNEFIKGVIVLIQHHLLTPEMLESMSHLITRNEAGNMLNSLKLNAFCHCIAGLAEHHQLTVTSLNALLHHIENISAEQEAALDSINHRTHILLSERVQARIFSCNAASVINFFQAIFPSLAPEARTEERLFSLLDPRNAWLLSDEAWADLWDFITLNGKFISAFALLTLLEIVGGAHDRGEAVTPLMLAEVISHPDASFPEKVYTNPYTDELEKLGVDVPEEYICPLSRQIMHDPVQIAQGKPPYFIADRALLTEWITRAGNHPHNPLIPITLANLKPVPALKEAIDAFMERKRTAAAREVVGMFQAVTSETAEGSTPTADRLNSPRTP